MTVRKNRKYPHRLNAERVAEARPSHRLKPAEKQMKSFRLAGDKIKLARQVLGTKTDTGTIEAALDMVIFRQELLDGLDSMKGAEFISPESMDAGRS